MKTLNKASATSNVIHYLWGYAAATFFLTLILSWWLVSGSWSAWNSARNNVIQFDDFYHVLQVSNDLASERAYANELILSDAGHKATAWQNLVNERRTTDADLAKIPNNLLSDVLLNATLEQLKRSREAVDRYRNHVLSDTGDAQRTINAMVTATDFYHEALYRRTSEFLLLEPSALGPILRAQALGELRDATGRLGGQLLIPLARQIPIPLHNSQTISRGLERINVLWWLMRTQGDEAGSLQGFKQLLENTRLQFEEHGEKLINQLQQESENGGHYSVDAERFAVQYHASLNSFDEVLNAYLMGVKKYYRDAERDALYHLILVVAILAALCALTTGVILYIRSRLLQPMLRLNDIAVGIINGKRNDTLMDESTAQEVKTLFSSLGTLGDKLQEQTRLSQKLQRQSEEDPLTHVFNRRAFDARASAMLAQANREFPAWLIMLDVDHFKSINDTWGHPTGDTVLVALAAILKKFSRPGDVIGRLGGEEFAVLFQMQRHEDVAGYTSRIQNEIRKQGFQGPQGEPFTITASFGVSCGWQCPLAVLMADADKALYEAKNSGRDRICGLPA